LEEVRNWIYESAAQGKAWATDKDSRNKFAGKWMELKNIILCEVSQAHKAKNRMFSLICGL
jgi:hypothetical protein